MTKRIDFNDGYMCRKCGIIEKLKKKTINKTEYQVCQVCEMQPIGKWSKPLNERPGRCGTCGEAAFKLAIYKGDLLRCCKKCSEVFNIDKNKVKRPGKKEFKC